LVAPRQNPRGGRRRGGRWLHVLGALLLAVLTAPAAAVVRDPATANAEDLARIEDYLNSLRTLRAEFLQIGPDGGTATGTFYYDRPDKMRLDYDPPSELLIIANDWKLVYQDRRLEQTSQLFTSQTPLGFLLEDEIDLRDADVTVTSLDRRGGEIQVTLVQTDEPAEGSITLAFAEQPFELRRWTIVDAQGYATHIVLEGVETGVPLDGELFIYRDPRFYPELRR
jgi:outer membrane lipoprotein-sorting protein